jgi:hypothetical protein
MISLAGPKLYKARTYNISVNGIGAGAVTVRKSKGKLIITDVEFGGENNIIRVGDSISLKVSLKNTGGSEGEFPLILRSDGKEFMRENITLPPGEERVVQFSYYSGTKGLKQLTINDLWKGSVKVYNDPLESVFLRYPFENVNDSLVADESGLGNHGHLGANRGGALPASVDGIDGKALRFDGRSSFIKIPGMLLQFPMTISVWVKPGPLTETSTAGRQMIFYVSEPMGNDGYGPEPEIHLMRSEGNTFVFWANAGRQRIDLRHPIGDEGIWTHITSSI